MTERNQQLGEVRKIIFSKRINESIKRAMVQRLAVILEEHEGQYERWQENVKHRLNKTRQRDLKRKFEKNIQAMKIVVNFLTPYAERMYDEPSFVVKKKSKQTERTKAEPAKSVY